MIEVGKSIKLRDYKKYPNNPEKDEPVGYGEDKIRGKYQQFQVMDSTIINGKIVNGWGYVRVFSDVPLKVDDLVTVKSIKYVQIKNTFRKTIVVTGIAIEETSPFTQDTQNETKSVTEEDLSSDDFDFDF